MSRTTRLVVSLLAIPALGTACNGAPGGRDASASHDTVTIVLETGAGEITAELYPDRAPITVANFLHYVDGGFFDGATFYRAVRLDNQPAEPRIEVIQGGVAFSADAWGGPTAPFPPIAHEPTSRTGIRHLDGTLSMARSEVGTASSEFFITIDTQASLDSGGTRNPDGQGFAAFGRVISGMDVVRQIQSMPTGAKLEGWAQLAGQMLVDPVPIVRARRRRPDDAVPLATIATDTARVRSLRLSDGRALSWAEYGDPNGVPVFELHGGGASHRSGAVYHREAEGAGVRVIAVDRPGAGGSTPNPDLSFASFPSDLRQLADHLGLRRFVVMGNSNGGAFAVAVAHALPDRVLGAIPLNPATPVFDDSAAWRLTPIYHGLAGRNPAEIAAGMEAAMRRFLDDPAAARAEDPFQQFPDDTESDIVRLYFDAIDLTPAETMTQEVGLILQSWGFDVFDVQPRVELFTGLTEIATSYNELWVGKLPNAALHHTTGGHAGQTAPETRWRLMRCVVALSEERTCRP